MHTTYIVGLILAGFVKNSLGNAVPSSDQQQMMISGNYSKIPSDRIGCDTCGGTGKCKFVPFNGGCDFCKSFKNPNKISCDSPSTEQCETLVKPFCASISLGFVIYGVKDYISVHIKQEFSDPIDSLTDTSGGASTALIDHGLFIVVNLITAGNSLCTRGGIKVIAIVEYVPSDD